jgi:glutamyl-tRNA(Gln) amidotransferase subunit E
MSLWNTDDIDYKALGFRCGVEIHQQLDTEKKLFCHCPVGLVDDPPDARILRHMRPTLSEMGEYDGTALMEKKTRKEIIYEILNDRVCTYEMDDTPPFLINQQALDIGIRLALLFQCKIVDEVHVSRKQYLDGSIPTGFQRTAVVGIEGWIPYKGRRIGISQINVEEDACREVSDVGHRIVFRTDRLSIPLVEVITKHHMLDPVEAGEVTYLLAETNRISGLVRRGIGTARQDVNVSITGGDRVEIKGVEKIRYIPALTHFEALRQRALLDLREKLLNRRISPDNFSYMTADVTKYLAGLNNFSGKWAVDHGGTAGAIALKGFRGLLQWPVFPERTFADEIGGRLRVIACLDKMPNLAYSLNRTVIGIPDNEWEAIRKALSAGADDAMAVTWGPAQDVATALDEIAIRCREALIGIPRETRQVLSNGRYTDFERILPGPDRMYPDTDHPPISIEESRIKKALADIPEFPFERKAKLKQEGLSDHLIHELVVHPRYNTFRRMAEISGDIRWAAVVVAEKIKHLWRKGFETSNITDERLLDLARFYGEKRFYREGTLDILKDICRNGSCIADAIEETIFKIPKDEFEIMADEIINDNNSPRDPEKRFHFQMGQVMRKYRGAVSGKLLWDKITGAKSASK